MSKTITIDRCWHCKFRDEETDFCSKLAKYIFDISEIMPDCPLPDSGAAQQAMLEDFLPLAENLYKMLAARRRKRNRSDEEGLMYAFMTLNELKQKYGVGG